MTRRKTMMKTWTKRVLFLMLVMVCLQLSGCSGNVGVGLSVGVPIGDHGYVSVGSGRWF